MPNWLHRLVFDADTWRVPNRGFLVLLPARYIAWRKVVAANVDLRVLLLVCLAQLLTQMNVLFAEQVVKFKRCIAFMACAVFSTVTPLLPSLFLLLFTSDSIPLAFALLHPFEHLVRDTGFLPVCVHGSVARVLLLHL